MLNSRDYYFDSKLDSRLRLPPSRREPEGFFRVPVQGVNSRFAHLYTIEEEFYLGEQKLFNPLDFQKSKSNYFDPFRLLVPRVRWWQVREAWCPRHKVWSKTWSRDSSSKEAGPKGRREEVGKSHQRQHATQVGQLACVQLTYIPFGKGLWGYSNERQRCEDFWTTPRRHFDFVLASWIPEKAGYLHQQRSHKKAVARRLSERRKWSNLVVRRKLRAPRFLKNLPQVVDLYLPIS